MSATRWFALIDGAAAGPFTAAELSGRGADLLVCAEGQSAWVAAVTFPELASVVVSSPSGAPARIGSTRYYAYIAGQMHGPYEVDNLKPFLQPELMVCREGSQDWLMARDVSELAVAQAAPPSGSPARSALQPVAFAPVTPASAASAPAAPAPASKPVAGAGVVKAGGVPETAPRDLPPLLKEFWMICRNASNELLVEQKAKHWKRFFKNEQQIIATEMERRGLKA